MLGIARKHSHFVFGGLQAGLTSLIAAGIASFSSPTIAQFLGRGIREGHDENFRWRERPRAFIRRIVPEHQPHIEHRDRKGLARAGARFDHDARERS